MPLANLPYHALTGPLVRGVGEGGVSGFSPGILFANSVGGAWYDASDLTTLFSDSAGTTVAVVDGPVGKMLDKSGNGNHLTQATTASKPTLRNSGSLYWLEFDGVDDHLKGAASAFAVREAVAGVSFATQSTIVGLLTGQSNSGQSVSFLLDMRGDFTPKRFDQSVAAGAGLATSFYRNGVLTPNVTLDAAAVYRADSDGTLKSAPYQFADGVLIGNDRMLSGRYANMKLFGMFVLGTQRTAAERAAMDRYLAIKSGVTL